METFTPRSRRSRRLCPRARSGIITTPRILLVNSTRHPDPQRKSASRARQYRENQQTASAQKSDRDSHRRKGDTVRKAREKHVTPTPSNSDPRDSYDVDAPQISARDLQLYLDPGRDEKTKLEHILKKSSVVYARKCQQLPKVYQNTQRLRSIANKSYPFTSPKGQELFPTLTVKLEPDVGSRGTTPCTQTPVSGETTASCSLPSLPRTPFSTTLLRRPTTLSPRPLVEEDEGFQAFANRLDLKPLLIDDSPAKTLKFYTCNYPLLLQKLMDEERDKYVDRRSVTPSLSPNMRKRGTEVNNRLLVLDTELDELDKQTTDGKFFTELRDETFDPRKWPWNRQRYK